MIKAGSILIQTIWLMITIPGAAGWQARNTGTRQPHAVAETSGQTGWKKGNKVFIINNAISDLEDFGKLVKAASRLKEYGTVQINIATLADKSFHEIPKGGNPWNEYASNNATLYKFFPDPKIAPFIPAGFVNKNRLLLLAKAKILRDNGMEGAFFANEPGFLPATFFDAYPQLRGPRVDHPRRSNQEAFSPCLSVKETQEIYTGMMAAMLKAAPEIKTFYFKTNDAGSGNCWSDWLYNGPNGPEHCKSESTGERIQKLMSAIKEGAARSNSPLSVYLSFPQGSSNFSDPERTDIQNRLPDNCYFKSLPGHEIESIGSEFSFLYPVKGICDVVSLIDDLQKIDEQKQQTVFISFNSFYGRGNQNADVEDLFFSLLEDHLRNGRSDNPTPALKLRQFSESWAGKKNAELLETSLLGLHEAFRYKSSFLGNLAGINWNLAARMINRPLVIAPQRLTADEENYFLPYIFNVSLEEARMDYTDIQGGRWSTNPDSVKTYVRKIKQVAEKLDAIDAPAPKAAFLFRMALALRVHASLIRSCGNFAAAQLIRDNNKEKLTGEPHRPGKEPTWSGDTDLLKFNAIMRDELDNTTELIDWLQPDGTGILCLAKDAAHEDCFTLSPGIIGQLKKKRKVTLAHWRDIEGYMTSPFK